MAKAFLFVIQTLVLSCILSELTQRLYEDHWCCKTRSDIKVPSKARYASKALIALWAIIYIHKET